MKKLVTLVTAVTIIVTGLASGQSVNKEQPLPEPDRGSVSGQTYKNGFFGFTYELPQGWSPLSADELKEFDEEKTRQSIERYGPDGRRLFESGVLAFSAEWTLLHAAPPTPESKPGRFAPVIVLIAEEGNPFQRGSSGLTKGKPIDNYFPFSSVADPLQSPDHRMERRPTPLSLGGKNFVRADFRIKKKGGDIWEAWFVTFAKGYFLRLEIGAGSREELDGLAKSTKSLSFSSQKE